MSAERIFAVKEEMDKAEARHLQRFFVRAFFRKALDEAQAVVAERTERSAAQDEEIRTLCSQIEELTSLGQGIRSERDQGRKEVEAIRRKYDTARQAKTEAKEALTALRIEVATLTERAAHADELRAMVRSLQERQTGDR